jgi:tRNA modification GTPase
MDYEEDTIVAVASPRGPAPRAIIRLSGPEAQKALSRLFRFRDDSGEFASLPTYTSHQGWVDLSEEELTLPAILYVMRAPYSYTCEDVFEIHTIGSPPLLAMVLEALISRGVRLAQPGEFTRRAFLNGRIDLSQAEAVMRLVRSTTEAQRRSAISQLRGALSTELNQVRNALLEAAAEVEAAIDFSDQDMEFISQKNLREMIEKARNRIERYLKKSREESIFSEEIIAVLFGRTNVGKSSLFNRLSGAERAIVTRTPGTTRDTLEAAFEAQGLTFRLIDTAGVQPPQNTIEELAIARSYKAKDSAHMVLFVIDGSTGLLPRDRELFLCCKDAPCVVLVNKSDLVRKVSQDEILKAFDSAPVLFVSARTGQGTDQIKKELLNAVLTGKADLSAPGFILEVRHKVALEAAREALNRAFKLIEDDRGIELVAVDLREALDWLGQITGAVVSEDILDRIFSQFCIGK